MNIIQKHWKIIVQVLFILAFLTAAQHFSRLLPGVWRVLIGSMVVLLEVIFLGIILIFLTLQIIQNFRFERALIPDKLIIGAFPILKKYRILNPLEVEGTFHRTQLHTHSILSYDSKVPAEQIVQSYQNAGYDVLAITDHDRFSDFSNLSSDKMLVLPGVEETVPVLFWPIPLGKHLVLINPKNQRTHSGTVQERLNQALNHDSLVIPAHLSWRGGAGTGRWYPEELYRLKNLQLVEIDSPHSKDPLDLTIWHKLIIKGGPEHPVWGVAVDDSHTGSANIGWIMVKAPRMELTAIITSIKNGAFYASNGPSNLDIKVDETRVRVNAPGAAWIRFFNGQNHSVMAVRAEEAVYQSMGDEGFIRVEVSNRYQNTAWSQPMWLVAE